MDQAEVIADLTRQIEEKSQLIAQLKMVLITAVESCDRFERHRDIRSMLVVMLGWCVI